MPSRCLWKCASSQTMKCSSLSEGCWASGRGARICLHCRAVPGRAPPARRSVWFGDFATLPSSRGSVVLFARLGPDKRLCEPRADGNDDLGGAEMVVAAVLGAPQALPLLRRAVFRDELHRVLPRVRVRIFFQLRGDLRVHLRPLTPAYGHLGPIWRPFWTATSWHDPFTHTCPTRQAGRRGPRHRCRRPNRCHRRCRPGRCFPTRRA